MRTLAITLLLTPLLIPQAGRAQAPTSDPPSADADETSPTGGARALFARGAAEFEAEHYAQALDLYTQAYDAERVSALLFNIGSALDRLGRAEQAIVRYEAYLAAVPDAENRPYVESRLRLLRAQLPAPFASHHEAERQTAASEGEAAASEGEAAASAPSRAGPIALMLGGGAVVVTGAVLGGLALNLKSDLDGRCVDGRCAPEDRSDADRMDRFALSSDVLIATGGAALVGGLIWLLIRGHEDSGLSAAGACTPDGCSLTGSLSF